MLFISVYTFGFLRHVSIIFCFEHQKIKKNNKKCVGKRKMNRTNGAQMNKKKIEAQRRKTLVNIVLYFIETIYKFVTQNMYIYKSSCWRRRRRWRRRQIQEQYLYRLRSIFTHGFLTLLALEATRKHPRVYGKHWMLYEEFMPPSMRSPVIILAASAVAAVKPYQFLSSLSWIFSKMLNTIEIFLFSGNDNKRKYGSEIS